MHDAISPAPADDDRPLALPPVARRGRILFWVRVAIGVAAASAVAAGWAAWKFVQPKYSAITFCRMFGQVDWDVDATDWQTGGTTEVNLSPYNRNMFRFPNGIWGGVLRGSAEATDADLARLADLPPVRLLDLNGVGEIKGPGLAILSRLGVLRDLRMNRANGNGIFRGPMVRDETLRWIASGPKLRTLHINGARITDDGLAAIAAFRDLEDLDLSWTKAGDAGLAHLKDLSKLEKLDLTATQITDAGLASLRELTGLRVLVLHRTQVTPAGIKALQAALPTLEQVDSGGMLGRDYDREDTAP